MNTKPNLPYYLHKTANTLYRWKIPVLPFCIKQFMRIALGAVIPYEAKIGENVHFGFNGLGIVIHRKCIIGSNVHIFHQVTIAGGR